MDKSLVELVRELNDRPVPETGSVDPINTHEPIEKATLKTVGEYDDHQERFSKLLDAAVKSPKLSD